MGRRRNGFLERHLCHRQCNEVGLGD